MKILGAALCLFSLGLFQSCAKTPAVQPTKLVDISYGTGERHTVDFYFPEKRKNAPVVLFVHGGRWFRNDKSQIERYDRISQLNDAGFVIASMNYRYSSEAIWPAQQEDVLRAAKFVSKSAGLYGYNGDEIGLWGQSSGAHMVLMATAALMEDPEPRVGAVVSWYAPSDLTQITSDRVADAVPGENERFSEPSPESLLIGGTIKENVTAARSASPITRFENLPKNIEYPEILLVHGEQDFVISPLQSQRLYDVIQEKSGDGKIKLRMVPNGKHGGSAFDAETPVSVEFFKQNL